MQTIDLSLYRKNYFSQCGEDGIIEKLFEILNIKEGWIVEFGCSDGMLFSNSRHHYLKNKNHNLLLIDKDHELYAKAIKNYIGYNNVFVLNEEITENGRSSLNNIFHSYSVDKIALLSIDVDGEDFNIWKSLDKSKFSPEIVVIELPLWYELPKLFEYEKQFLADGYNLVYVTGNYIFVRNDLGIKSLHAGIYDLLQRSNHPDVQLIINKIDRTEYDNIISELNKNVNFWCDISKPQQISYGL